MIPSSSSLRERIAFGQKQRQILKRSDHSKWDAKKRKLDPVDIIRATDRERIPALVPIKIARMAVSPFGFFRGSCFGDGGRPGHNAVNSHHGADLWRCTRP
jgi:hypothetical protein